MSKKSPNIVVHFYRDSTERCKIVDKHLQILSKKHIEAKFCKVNAEKSPFLTQRLRIKVIPTIALIKDNKTKDYIVGFDDLGGRDDFTTEMMEWRIAQSGAIEYNVSKTKIYLTSRPEKFNFSFPTGRSAHTTGSSEKTEEFATTTEEDNPWQAIRFRRFRFR